jgi:DNA-directed RNA polymerase beta subunit/DNA-directed RNA polymerase beta' subunit/intein/homing endonuclease
MRTFHGSAQFDALKTTVTDAYKKLFPVYAKGQEGKSPSLHLKNIWVDDAELDPNNFTDQKKTKLAGRTWGAPVFADIELKDPSGHVIDKLDKIRISTIPRLTPRGSYLVQGSEYQIANQFRRKAGVYVLPMATGDQFKAVFNVLGEGSRNFEVHLDPKSNKYALKVGQGFMPLYPFLNALGAKDDDLKKAWGEEVFAANKVDPNKHVQKLAEKLTRVKTDNKQTAIEALHNFGKAAKLDPSITELTLGKSYAQLDQHAIIAASKKLKDVYHGVVEHDDPENILFKEVLSVEDMLHDKLTSKTQTDALKYSLSRKLGKRTKIKDIVDFRRLAGPVESFFTSDTRSSTPEQYNPIHMLSESQKVTLRGTGGITDPHTITSSVREVHPSHVGFVDPVHTPEGENIGVTMHLAAGAVKDGRAIRTPAVNVRTGKEELLTPKELYTKVVAFPDEANISDKGVQFKNKLVKAQRLGKMLEAEQHSVDYVIPSHTTMFSYATNLVPFLHSDQGNRIAMAAKHLSQAIPLVDRDAPNVQTEVAPGKSFHEVIGRQFAVHAPEDGVVTKVTSDFIEVGKHKIHLYNDFPLRQKTLLHHEPLVKVGDKVKKGQLIADSNFTKNGTLALGKNLKVAYLPYPGLTFDDGIVITESAAKKLSTVQVYKHAFEVEPGAKKTDLRMYSAYFPNVIGKDLHKKFDVDGVIKKGAVVNPGELVIAGLKYDLANPELATLKRINKSLARPWSNAGQHYSGEFPGVVTDVVKRADTVEVYIKAVEPARESDKLSGVHGNKGVITKVILDSEAPRTKDGKIPDVILNPHGIIGRINAGQIFESAAGKIAEKTGKTYVVKNFNGKNTGKEILKELEAHNIDDMEEMFLPNGKSMGKVHIGNPYILRLSKTGKTGFSARMPGSGYDPNQQPTKGGEEGSKALDLLTFYSMLSHGAKKNLADAHQKSEKNDEYWHAIEMGKPLPAPRQTYAFNKFISLLHGAGVNTVKQGNNVILAPLTDGAVKRLSHGEIKEPEFLHGKDLKEKKGGFFDPALTGGKAGKNYTHIELKEYLPNPVFERPIRSLLNLTAADYADIVSGTKHVSTEGKVLTTSAKGTLTGGNAIQHLLSKIDVDKEIEATTKKLPSMREGNDLNQLSRKLRYLHALKELDLKPQDAYVRKLIPVVPPEFRPIYETAKRGLQVAPVNVLYQNVGILNKSQDLPVMSLLEDSEKKDLRTELYHSTKTLAGLEEIMRTKEQPIRGFLSQITGDTPKTSFFLNKVINKRQDLVGRGVITASPDLHIDQLGIPEKMAWKIFHPFIIREFTSSGITPDIARKEIEEKTPRAKQFLQTAMDKRTVLMNRAPSLHKFSIMAFKPTITDGLAIKVPPLVLKGFGGDFDGDFQQNRVLVHLTEKVLLEIEEVLGHSYAKERDVTARYKESVVLKKGEKVLAIDLQDFPVGALVATREASKGQIDLYEAIPGTNVIAYDEQSGRIELKPVTYWSKHYDREVEIVTLVSGRQIVTDDDPRAVYGIPAGFLSPARFTPEHAVAKTVLVPRAININPVESIVTTYVDLETEEGDLLALPLNENLGYLIGAAAGDGWSDDRHFCLASITPEIPAKVFAALKDLGLVKPDSKFYKSDRKQAGLGDVSSKYSCGGARLAKFIKHSIGHRAKNKHLPEYFLGASREFREGLFAGLMDTDGSISVSNAKDKVSPQLMANYSTNSLRLAREIQLLARTLGIRASITASKTPAGNPCWMMSFSNVDIKQWDGKSMQHPGKLAKLASIQEIKKTASTAKLDIIPITKVLATFIAKTLGAPRTAPTEHKRLYGIANQAAKDGFVSRQSIDAVIEKISRKVVASHPDGQRWLALLDNRDVTWDRCVSFERTGIKETGYDLTVPGHETFMAVDGVILSNTSTIHVPTSDEAVRESFKMLPSQNLFKPGTGELMIQPSQENAIGLYFLSQSKEGRARINALLPKDHHISAALDKKGLGSLFNSLAKTHTRQYADIVHKLKQLGDSETYARGFSVGVKDVVTSTATRDKIFDIAEKKVAALKKAKKPGLELDHEIAGIYTSAAKEAYEHTKQDLKKSDNAFYHMVTSGARGKDSQLQQLVTAPGIVTDAKDRPVPIPLKRSYAEGISTSDYFVSSYGVRKGMIDKSLQTSQPGAMNKNIMANTVDNIITSQDCGVRKGIELPISSHDVNNRFLASDQHGFKRNTLVTPQLISNLTKRGVRTVQVRTPLECIAPKGTCAHCFGLDEHGKAPELGDNIGAKAGQALSEPLTQSSMKTFHTGGVAGEVSMLGGFPRIKQLLTMPKYVAGEAPLAKLDGKVTQIKTTTNGAHVVIAPLSKEGKPEIHPLPPNRKIKVKLGDKVQAGDPLTHGVLNPQEILKYRGMKAAQNYVVDELKKTYDEISGVGRMERRAIETLVRSFGNYTKVKSAPKQADFKPGDIIPFTVANHYNETRAETLPTADSMGYKLRSSVGKLPQFHEIGHKDIEYLHGLGYNKVDVVKDPLIHTPIMKGVERLPKEKKDWLAQLGYQHIKDTLSEGAAEAWKSSLQGEHPIPAYAFGATFGQKKEHY